MTTHQTKKLNNPLWFKILNLAFLLPIIFWPLVLFGSIFLFDSPGNFFLRLLFFLLIIAYPLYLIFLLVINARLFKRNRILATLLPIVTSSVLLTYAFNFFGGPAVLLQLFRQIGTEPPAEINYDNVIGFNYRKDSTNLFYGDTLVKGADLSTFELVNFHWARDRNRVYFKGKPVAAIDSRTFKYLGSGYSIDTNYVFYDTTVVEGADLNTFDFVADSDDGQDTNYCYRKGRKIDCSKLRANERTNHR